ncbi:hypothetical protein FGG79_06250 [Bacillus sp. BHET2]|uniref:hypothetical protein n=1 Tax=Bacillus sp. BHET2 TaxID=2583818 RepID=UPI00110EA332|nr:hypothetical protein [Bacillus sp. BHET2]TMU87713.1 hypothetical protein FGG79_06250 [Bacillus sp. BHET2]
MKQLSSIQLQQQIIHYKSEMEKYRQKCSFLAEKSLAQKYNALQKENQDLRKKVDEYDEYLENKEMQMEKQSQDSLSLHIAQEKEISKLRFTVNQLRDQLRKINHRYTTDSKLYTERLQLFKDSFHKEIISSQMTITHLKNELEMFLSTKEATEKQLYKKEIELWELEKLLEGKEQEWNREQESLLLQSVSQKNRIDLLVNEQDTFHKEIISSQMTTCHLTNEMEMLLSTKEDTEKQLYKKEFELWELEQLLGGKEQEWNRQHESLLLKSVSQENRIDLLMNEQDTFHKEIISLQMTICHLTNEMQMFLSTKEEMEMQLYKKEIELWELEKLLGGMVQEWNRKHESFLVKSVCQENRIDLLENENDNLKTQLSLKEEVMNDAFQQLKDMTFYYENILFHQTNKLTEASHLERNYEETIRTLKTKLEKQQADIEMYTNTLQTVKMNIRQMKEEAFIFGGGDSSETKKLLKNQESTIQHLQFTNALLIDEINKLKNKRQRT